MGGTPNNFNELRFEDKKGEEQVFIHAEKDMSVSVKNDHSVSVGHDQSMSVEHDRTATINNNDTLTVKNARTVTVDGTHTETIEKDTVIKISNGTYNHDVAGNTSTYHVKGSLTENYDDIQTTTVVKNLTIDCKASILITAADEIKFVTGESMVLMRKDGTIQIHGKNIEVIGATEVKNGVGTQTVTLDNQKVAVAGVSLNSTAVGVHEIQGALIKIG
jgi:type VI secretion system secreted protein VgrG